MALITETPVVLKQANKWDITYFEGRPRARQFMFVVEASDNGVPVDTQSVSVDGDALASVVVDSPQVAMDVIMAGGTIDDVLFALMYAYAKATGVIPAEAVEEPVEEPVTEEPVVPADGE